MIWERMARLIDDEVKAPSHEQYNELRDYLRHSERVMHHLCMEAGFPPPRPLRLRGSREKSTPSSS